MNVMVPRITTRIMCKLVKREKSNGSILLSQRQAKKAGGEYKTIIVPVGRKQLGTQI